MKPIDVLTSPWAIIPDKLHEITEIYSTHLRGEKIDLAALEARIGAPLQREDQGYQIERGVALIPMDGVMAKRMNLFSRISGGASTELIARDVRNAVADPKVKSIVLMIDSPGGSVDGTQSLAAVIRQAAAEKPVVAWADGMMASAAYWAGSAADSIFLASDTTFMGSIGVVSQHVDMSEYQKKMGIKTTEIYAGKYKRIASEYAPLSKEGHATIQDMVDTLYSIFVGEVANHRGVSVETVLKDMADGRLFIGQQAISAGLADGVSSLEGLIDQLATGTYQPRRGAESAGAAAPAIDATAAAPVVTTETTEPAAGAAPVVSATPDQFSKGTPMDKATLQKDHPALAAELAQEAAAAERQRILDVEAQALPGHEALIAQFKADGKTTGPEAALAVLNAEKKLRGNAAADLAADAGTPVPATPSQSGDHAAAADNKNLPVDARCKAKWDADANIRAEFGGSFESFVAFTKAEESGHARIFSK